MTQFRDTDEWRKANDIDTLYNSIELPSYEQSRRMVRQFCPVPNPRSPDPTHTPIVSPMDR